MPNTLRFNLVLPWPNGLGNDLLSRSMQVRILPGVPPFQIDKITKLVYIYNTMADKFIFDSRGRVIGKESGNQMFDARGRLVARFSANGQTYDNHGKLVGKGDQRLRELDKNSD